MLGLTVDYQYVWVALLISVKVTNRSFSSYANIRLQGNLESLEVIMIQEIA